MLEPLHERPTFRRETLENVAARQVALADNPYQNRRRENVGKALLGEWPPNLIREASRFEGFSGGRRRTKLMNLVRLETESGSGPLPSALADRLHHVAAFQHRRRALLEALPGGDVPAERVGEADDHAEHPADGGGVAQRLLRDAGCVDRLGVRARQLVRAQRQLLEEEQRRRELRPERRGAPVVDDRLPNLLTERVRRNCAVGAQSERALVQ